MASASAPASTLVILVPSAHATVGRLRRRLDSAAAWSVPLHISLLYPFAPRDSISDDDAVRLGGLLRAFDPFDFVLSEVGWFDERVMYVAPTPKAPFVELTNRIVEEFPHYRPYGGAYREIVPHMTVGEGLRPARMRRTGRRLERHLPIRAAATEVSLMTPDTAGRWSVVQRFPLGRPTP
jgi:2'-5' RNA ligase